MGKQNGRFSTLIGLESVSIGGGAKCMLGCSSQTCNEAVGGLESLQGRGDMAKLKWWMPEYRYSRKLNSTMKSWAGRRIVM